MCHETRVYLPCAMVNILKKLPDRTATADELAVALSEVFARYSDGGPVPPTEILTRAGRRHDLFEKLPGRLIRLRPGAEKLYCGRRRSK